MKFQKSTAPLLDWSAVSSRREFTPHPLGDNKVNAMLAASFKAGWKGGAATSEAEINGNTSYQDAFTGYRGDRLKSAKMKSAKPKSGRTRTITGMTDLLETRPLSHVSFHAHPQDLAKAGTILLPKPNLGFISKWEGPPEPLGTAEKRRGPSFVRKRQNSSTLSGIDTELRGAFETRDMSKAAVVEKTLREPFHVS
ncbi:unnamed protein product [Durusdinium trenchii]|uniref:Uncharacterized protein n=1 Tax=Durusdinium trenchii TaxID=1381693 RepID=A0ABP0NI23_9DINO